MREISVKRQIIFASLKGGVGKSYGARMFLDTARRVGRRVSAWDLDGATGSLARRYSDRDPEVGAGTEDVRNPRAPGAWLDALYGGADDVLLDVPGGALGDLLRVIDVGRRHSLWRRKPRAGNWLSCQLLAHSPMRRKRRRKRSSGSAEALITSL